MFEKQSTRELFPSVYDGVLEISVLAETDDVLLDQALAQLEQAQLNQFILTADEETIEVYEKMFSILANPSTESLEFRRERILNRMSLQPPFTMRWLQNKLDEIIGVGKWNAYVDYVNRTLYVESFIVNQLWFNELRITINRIKPCNLVFINKPLLIEDVLASETVFTSAKHYNYVLGHWQLGQKPFATIDPEEVIKLPSVKSIDNNLLTDVAAFSASDVVAVRLNGSVKITEFTTKEGQGTMTLIEYEVKPEQAREITQIELLGTGDRVLTSSAVYIPVTEAAICKHTINFKEGE
jgi:hypothetical protein